MTFPDKMPSPYALFRWVALLAALAVGMQQFALLAWLAPVGWVGNHLPLFDLWSALSGLPAAAALPSRAHVIQLTYLLAPLLFALAFWQGSRPLASSRLAAWLALQLLLGLAFNPKWLLPLAAELALVLPLRPALAWLLGQMLAYLVFYLLHAYATQGGFHLNCSLLGGPVQALPPEVRLAVNVVETVKMAVYQLAAFGIGYLGAQERRGRQQLARVHAATRATQQLLGDATRAAERVRIARELHDAVGHQLTAINLHLDLAQRQSGPTPIAPLTKAYDLAQRLLAEVRAIVGIERKGVQRGEA